MRRTPANRSRAWGWVTAALLVAAGAAVAARLWTSRGAPQGDLNVLLISIDTLRADRLGCYGFAAARTPNIDRLARRGVLFSQCISSAPLTLPSHATMLTGKYPYSHGARDNGTFFVADEHVTLAETLRDAGYATQAIVASVVLNREFGLAQGFDAYVDMRTADGAVRRGQAGERRGDVVCDAAVAALRGLAGRPFFLWTHFFDPHYPYDAPGEFRQAGAHPYDDEIAFVDAQVGRLLDELDRLGVGHRTLVVLTADHGEGLGEHGEDTHGNFVFDSTLHVPLILACPGVVPAGRRVDAQVRLVDIAPTVLDLLGRPALNGIDGESLRPLMAGSRDPGPAAYAEAMMPYYSSGYAPPRAFRKAGWKYIHAPRPHLYHVARDPSELHNVAPDQPQRLADLYAELRRQLEAAAAAALGSALPDSEEMRRLRHEIESQGYVGASRGPAFGAGQSDVDLLALDAPDPHDRIAQIERACQVIAHVQNHRNAEAETLLRETLAEAADPSQESAACRQLGLVLARTGRHEEAVGYFDLSLRTHPNDGETLTNKATSLAELGRFEESAAAFEAALLLPPVLPRTHLHFGIALGRMGRVDEALRQLERAVEVDPENESARLARARTLLGAGRGIEAVERLQSDVLAIPASVELRGLLAETLLGQSRWAEAREALRGLVERAPGNAAATFALAQTCAKVGDLDEADMHLRRTIELDRGHARAWNALASLHTKAWRWAEAANALRGAVDADPQSVDAHNDLAWLLATCPDDGVRDGAEALRHAERAVELSAGGRYYVLSTLAAALAETGRFDEANSRLDEAIRLATESGIPVLEELERQRAALRAGRPHRLGEEAR